MGQNYKLICWGIWLCGMLLVLLALLAGNSGYFVAHPFKLLFFSLFSSLPFFGLAVYARNVYKNKALDSYRRNIKLSGIAGAFALTCIYGLWTFSSAIQDPLDPAAFFIFFALGSMFIGFILGGLLYVAIAKIKKIDNNPTGG